MLTQGFISSVSEQHICPVHNLVLLFVEGVSLVVTAGPLNACFF